MRTVIVASPAANQAKKIEGFTGTTWGELKSHPLVAGLISGNMEAILNPGNLTLNKADAVLPEQDFKVFLVPTQNKAGISQSDAESIAKEIAGAIAKASASQARDLKDRIMEDIADFFDVSIDEIETATVQRYSGSPVSTYRNDVDQALEESRRYL